MVTVRIWMAMLWKSCCSGCCRLIASRVYLNKSLWLVDAEPDNGLFTAVAIYDWHWARLLTFRAA